MANIFQQIVNAIQSGGFSSGSAKTPTSQGGGTKNGGGSNASTASKPKSTSSKATSYSYTGKSTSTTKKSPTGSGGSSGGNSSGSSSKKQSAAEKALADYAVQGAVERARQRVDEATKAEPQKSFGFDALNAEVKAAQDKAKSAETNYLATLEKFNYNAGAPEVKSAQQVLDDALREAKIFTAAAEKGAQIKDRRDNVLSGAVKQTASGMVNAAGTAYEGGVRGADAQRERELAELQAQRDKALENYEAVVAKYGEGNANTEAAKANLNDKQNMINIYEGIKSDSLYDVSEKIYGAADKLAESGAEDIAQAKEGLGKGGQFAVDVGVAGAQLLGDLALGGAVPMTARAFGGAAGQARREGADYEEQVGYGAASAALEFVTEKIFGGDAGVYGKGLFDKVGQRILSKLNSGTGKSILRTIGQMGTEGAEEFVASVVDPLLQGIYNDKGAENWNEIDIADAAYDALVGAVLGGAGAVASRGAVLPAGEQLLLQSINKGQISEYVPPVRVSQEAIDYIADVMGRGRINNTAANNIINTPELTEAFNRAYPQSPLNGTTEQKREILRNAVRAQGASASAVNNSVVELERLDAEDAYQFTGLDSYVRGAIIGGANAEVATEIATDPAMRALWESMTGKTLPTNTKSAVKMIIQTKRKSVDLPLSKQDGKKNTALTGTENNIIKPATTSGIDASNEAPISTPKTAEPVAEDRSASASNANIPTPAPVVNTQNEEILQASESTNNAVSGAGGEITPSAQQNAEIGAPVELNNTTAQTTMGKGPERERNMSEGVRNNPANEAELRQSFEEAPEMYTQLTNAEVQAKADAILAKGFEVAEKEVAEAIGQAKKGRKLAPEYAIAAQNVANELTRQGNLSKARDLMSDVMAEFTAAGQFAQIGRLLRQSDPATKAMTIQKLVEKLNADLGKRQATKNIKRGVGDAEGKIVVSDELLNRFASASDEATRDAVMNEIEQTIADQIPATFRDKFTALRYLNMLGNFKTQGRNIVGNSLAAVATATKRRVQAATELGAALATGGKYERSTSLFVSPELRKQATADFANVADTAMGEARYSDAGRQASRGIEDKRTIFDGDLAFFLPKPLRGYVGKGMEGYRKATNWAMEAGDTIFLKFHYADALAGYLQARGVSNISEASPELLNSARAFAIKEAQEATFRDNNKVSDAVVKFGKGTDLEFINVLANGIMPFRKTPANVAVRAVEYSPVGLLKSATVDAYRASQGDISPADVINNAAKGATGSALAIAGYLLAQAGLAKGSEEDDKLAAFQKNQGEMDYSIKIGDTYVSLSQFAPMAVPFFMGVKLQEILEAQEGAISLDSATELLGAITDPMLEMSMLSGVNDAFSNLSNVSGDADALPQLVLNAMMSYWMQGLTNGLLSQFEQATEKNRQTTYTANETELDKFLGKGQYKVGQLAAKTPGVDYHQQDYVDAWGRTQSNGDAMTRAFNAFLNPTFSSEDRSTKVDAELERLYRDNKNTENFPDVFPQKRSRSEVYGDGKVMTADEYLQFSKDSGQMKLELVSDFIDSEQYANLDDKQRAKIISDLYQFADDRALKTVKEANKVNAASEWDDEAALPNLPAYLSAKTAFADASDAKNTEPNYAAVDAVLAGIGSMDKATRDALDKQSGFKNLRFAYEVFGMDAETAIGIDKMLDSEQAANLKGSNSGVADAVVIAKSYKGSDEEKLKALEVANNPYANTGKRRSVVRRTEAAMGQGLSFDQWAQVEAYVDRTKTSDNPNKATIVAAGNALGLNGNEVYKIYKKYPNDEDLVEQTNDYFNKDYVEPEDVDLFSYLTGLGLAKPDEDAAKTKSGGGRGYGGRYRAPKAPKPADLGDSVAAVKSIANQSTGSGGGDYLDKVLGEYLKASNKKQSAQPSVNWETLLAGYTKGIK